MNKNTETISSYLALATFFAIFSAFFFWHRDGHGYLILMIPLFVWISSSFLLRKKSVSDKITSSIILGCGVLMISITIIFAGYFILRGTHFVCIDGDGESCWEYEEVTGIDYFNVLLALSIGYGAYWFAREKRTELALSIESKTNEQLIPIADEHLAKPQQTPKINLGNDSEVEQVENSAVISEKIESSFSITQNSENSTFKPRKIDWEAVQAARKTTGDIGEALVLEYEKKSLERSGHGDLAKNVMLAGHGAGYDVFSYHNDGSQKYIEVKSSKNKTLNSFIITKNELDFMEQNLSNAYLYLVTGIHEEEPDLEIFSVTELMENCEITPTEFSYTL